MGHADPTGKYNTPLTPAEESAFQLWAKLHRRQNDLMDYDLRGAWKANAQEASNGHLPDTFKKPNHPTFSTESQYNGKDGAVGGTWTGDDKTGWTFVASRYNTRNMTPEELRAYFARVEPDAKLKLPPDTAEILYPTKRD